MSVLVEQSPGIWKIDADGTTTYANEAMAGLLRTTVDKMVGKPSFDFVYPEDFEAARQLFEAKGRGDTRPFEFRVRRADDTPLWVSVFGTPMHDAAGKFLGIIATFRAMRREGAVKSRDHLADKKT
jgi:two-component system cell cycle sensor histidine kinase/response regulator CckA